LAGSQQVNSALSSNFIIFLAMEPRLYKREFVREKKELRGITDGIVDDS